MKKMFIFIIFLLILSCQSTPTPVIIYRVPKPELTDDMSIEEYLRESTSYVIKLRSYIDELINQIIHKVPYIDLREEKKNADNTNK